MPAAITCTTCNRPLRVPEDVLGRMVQCPLCLDEFVAQADPAAEAAARAAEPPARRAAPKPQPVASRIQTEAGPLPAVEAADDDPVWVEPVAAAAPKKTASKAVEARALVFPVVVTRDPDRVLRGRMDGELTAAGLTLRKTRQAPAFASVGGKARYLGANRLVVTVEGREVELAVVKPWTSTHHLAKDVAAFLNGGGELPSARVYDVPGYLYALPVLFLALPFAAIPFGLFTDGCLGGFLWSLIALVLAGLTLAVALQAWLTPRARLTGAGGLLALGALIYLIAIPLTPSYTVDASLWQTYSPPPGEFRVQMPGTPAVTHPTDANGGADLYTVKVNNPDVRFTVYAYPTPASNNPFNNISANYYQAVNEAVNRLKQEFYLTYQSPQLTRDSYWTAQQQYHEVVYLIPSGFTSSAAGKTVAARIYVANGKTYTLAVLGPRVRIDAPDVLKFFTSFQVTGTPAKQSPLPGPGATSPNDLPGGGLLAYWSFDTVQGNNNEDVLDDSGNLLSGVLQQATPINDGARGKAVHFNGAGSYFDYSDAGVPNFGAGGEFTFAGWVRTRDNQGTVLSNRSLLDGSPLIDVMIENGALTAEVRQDGAEFAGSAKVHGKAVNDGAWHHFAVTRRGFGTIALTIDGALQGLRQHNNAGGPITTGLRALGAELYWRQKGVAPANANFTGDLDEFCVFGRALQLAEIKQLAGVRP